MERKNSNTFRHYLLKSGWLTKRGGNVKNWKRRYFTLTRDVLTEPILIYYEDETMEIKKGEIEIKHIIAVQNRCPPFNTPIFEIQTLNRCYLLQANTPLEMDSWTNALLQLVGEQKNSNCEVGIVKQGILSKQGNIVKNWKTRLFTLYLQPMPQIVYSDPHEQDFAKGFIDLSAIESVNECESAEGMPDFEVVIMDRVYVLRAETVDEMREWIETIINAVNSVTNRKVFQAKQKTQKSMRRLSVKPSILKQGWLEKRGEKGLKLWSNRYFILQIVSPLITLLKYYPGPDSSTPNGQIDVNEIMKITRDGRYLNLVKQGRVYELQASSDIEAHEWEVKITNSKSKTI